MIPRRVPCWSHGGQAREADHDTGRARVPTAAERVLRCSRCCSVREEDTAACDWQEGEEEGQEGVVVGMRIETKHGRVLAFFATDTCSPALVLEMPHLLSRF